MAVAEQVPLGPEHGGDEERQDELQEAVAHTPRRREEGGAHGLDVGSERLVGVGAGGQDLDPLGLRGLADERNACQPSRRLGRLGQPRADRVEQMGELSGEVRAEEQDGDEHQGERAQEQQDRGHAGAHATPRQPFAHRPCRDRDDAAEHEADAERPEHHEHAGEQPEKQEQHHRLLDPPSSDAT